jgi:hypothetical protein
MRVDLRFMYCRIQFVPADAVQLSATISMKLNPAEQWGTNNEKESYGY